MTPYELCLSIEVYNEKNETLNEEKLTLTWLGEYYHRVKKLPALSEVLKQIKNSTNSSSMSDEHMLKVAEALNFQFGGTSK